MDIEERFRTKACVQNVQPSTVDRVWFFVDLGNIEKGANISYARWRIDYERLLSYLLDDRTYAGCTAFVARGPYGEEYSESCRRLKAIGAEIDSRGYYDEARDCQKGVDTSLSLAAYKMAVKDKLDVAIVLSGDGDFVPLLDYFNEEGKRLEIASFSGSVSKEIRYGPFDLTYIDSFPILESVPRFDEDQISAQSRDVYA